MKHVADLMNVDNLSLTREEKQVSTTLNPMSVKLVEYVFAKFYMLCRGTDALYMDHKRLLAEKTQWQSNFTREGYTCIDHIRKALLKLERHRFPNPPQLGEFLAWNESSPDDLGLLTNEQAFNRSAEFMREGKLKDLSDDQNMLLELAVNESNRFFMRTNTITKVQPVFYRNYEIIMRNFLEGKIKPVLKGIEDNRYETAIKKQTMAYEQFNSYEKAVAELRRILGISTKESRNGTSNE